jgi:predicted DNA-binding protein
MPSQMLIRISPEIKNKFIKLSRVEGKNASQKLRELIEEYVQEHDIAAFADDLWDRIKKKTTSKGKTRKDIEAAIQESRRRR